MWWTIGVIAVVAMWVWMYAVRLCISGLTDCLKIIKIRLDIIESRFDITPPDDGADTKEAYDAN